MPTTLTRSNIRDRIASYLEVLQTLKVPTLPSEPLALFQTLKREKVSLGPYDGCSLFEVANRVMSDLVVFAAAEKLLFAPPPEILAIPLTEITVLLGNEDGSDLSAHLSNGQELIGECFNVAPSFFPSKFRNSRMALEKLKADVKLIAFNQEARSDLRSFEKWKRMGLHLLPIEVPKYLEQWRMGRASVPQQS